MLDQWTPCSSVAGALQKVSPKPMQYHNHIFDLRAMLSGLEAVAAAAAADHDGLCLCVLL